MKPDKIPKAKGNKELKKHLLGDRLTRRQAMLAKCADCMGYYIDGRLDCQMPECALYPFMPYGTFKPDTLKKSSTRRLKALVKAETRALENRAQDSLST